MTPEELLVMFTMATDAVPQPKPPALPPDARQLGTPDPLCPRCGGLGSVVFDTGEAGETIWEDCECLWNMEDDSENPV